jgi:hypothetical protein
MVDILVKFLQTTQLVNVAQIDYSSLRHYPRANTLTFRTDPATTQVTSTYCSCLMNNSSRAASHIWCHPIPLDVAHSTGVAYEL